jgi:hypothetical protein
MFDCCFLCGEAMGASIDCELLPAPCHLACFLAGLATIHRNGDHEAAPCLDCPLCRCPDCLTAFPADGRVRVSVRTADDRLAVALLARLDETRSAAVEDGWDVTGSCSAQWLPVIREALMSSYGDRPLTHMHTVA